MAESIADRVKRVVVAQLGVDAAQVVPEARFVEDLEADSLDEVILIMAIEEEFGVEISDDDADKLKTVNQLIAYMENLKG